MSHAVRSCPPQARLRILETTDVHVHLLPYDYYSDKPAPHAGLAKTAHLIAALRDEADNSLLFDNGDFLQGNPLSDWVAHDIRFRAGGLHPAIGAMNAVGYDAATLGNHEFNYGLAFLEKVLRGAAFPIVSANITRTRPLNEPLVPPHAILKRTLRTLDGQSYPIRIGVIGFAPPQIVNWERLHLKGAIATCDIVTAARHHVPRLLAAGADIVIALSHSGIGEDLHTPGMEHASVPLAAVEGIDAVLAGHTHLVFPGPDFPQSAAVDPVAGTLHGKPAVMAAFHGSHVGVIDLLLEHTAEGGWARIGHTVRVEPVVPHGARAGRRRLHRGVATAVCAAHRTVIDHIRRPIGSTAVALQSYFALVAADNTLKIVAEAQRAHAAQALAGTAWEGLPLLSAVAPFKAGGRAGCNNYVDIPAGPLALRHASELYVYPNSLCALEVTGADLCDWLERAASLFLHITPGETSQPLLSPAFPSYNFDVMDGVEYVIDPSNPARYDAEGNLRDLDAGRISALRCNGKAVAPDDIMVVVTNSYRAGGGGAFAAARRSRIIKTDAMGRTGTRDAVERYLAAAGELCLAPHATWRFASLPDTAAQFDSGPGALRHLGQVTDRHIDHIGPGEKGFERFTLHM